MRTSMRWVNNLILMVMFLALAAWAGGGDEFWEERPYQEWTPAEVQTIIVRSPWSQTVRTEGVQPGYDWGGGSRAEAGGPQPSTGPAAATSTGEIPRAGGRGEDVLAGSSSAQPGAKTYYVLWSSAQTVRRALARNRVLQGLATPEQVAAALEQPVTSYAVTIIGVDLSAFNRVPPEPLKTQTYLQASKQKKSKLHPERVEIARSGPAETIASVTFYFPRELESGEPFLIPEEKKVEFRCEVKEAGIEIKAGFELKHMTIAGERDL